MNYCLSFIPKLPIFGLFLLIIPVEQWYGNDCRIQVLPIVFWVGLFKVENSTGIGDLGFNIYRQRKNRRVTNMIFCGFIKEMRFVDDHKRRRILS
jgi:hypothetical protein